MATVSAGPPEPQLGHWIDRLKDRDAQRRVHAASVLGSLGPRAGPPSPRFEVEHIVPTSQQGADEESNAALSCRSCNLKKSDHQTGIDETTQTEVRLFNPREDRWDEHFQVDSDSAEILGLSPVGRATVARLDLNAPDQLQARQQWMRLRLYP